MKKPLTLVEFLCDTITEDVEAEINQLMLQKQQLEVRRNNATRQFDAQIANIDKQLMMKQKQRENNSRTNDQADQQSSMQAPVQQANTTTTPGSGGAQTPGVS